MNLILNSDYVAEGSRCEYYQYENCTNIAFKSFSKKSRAISAYENQKLLANHFLAPEVYGDVVTHENCWGFDTEVAYPAHWKDINDEQILRRIQYLVDEIEEKTGLKFWDCHSDNVGYIGGRLVCIDTGNESFYEDFNAWGHLNPGPICRKCSNRYCKCYDSF